MKQALRTLDDVDVAALYRSHAALSQRQPKPAAEWDERAQNYAASACADPHDPYASAFMQRMNLEGVQTLLDVGCGPGTIALRLAGKMQQVYAMDYSAGMLQALRERAAAQGIGNVQCLHLAWEDDWSAVPVCDVAVASRATMVGDLQDALQRISSRARRHVYATFTVDRQQMAHEIMSLMGRADAVEFPDWIYAVNLLRRMGYLPHVDYISAGLGKPAPPDTLEEFIRRAEWSIGPLDAHERQVLKDYYGSHPAGTCSRMFDHHRLWAFVSWSTTPGQP